MYFIGLDLGATKIAAAIFNRQGKIIEQLYKPLQNMAGPAVGRLISDSLSELLTIATIKNIKIRALGICIPGIYYLKTGHVWAPNIPGWDDYPLLQEIKDLSVLGEMPAVIDSDRACYILGETWLGAAQGCQNAIFIAVGTGIGAGILIDGKILRGYQDIAGAIGWLALNRPFLENYISCGCFEYHASGAGLGKVAREYLKTHPEYKGTLRQKALQEINSYDVFNSYKENDLLARKIISEAIEYWGMAVANLVSLFNPEKIIFGGGLFGPAADFIADIYQEAIKWSQPISIKQVKLEASSLGGNAGLIGAGRLALNTLTKS